VKKWQKFMRSKAMIKDKEKYIHSIMYDENLVYILDMEDINYAMKPIAKVLYYNEKIPFLGTRDIDCIFLTDDGLERLEEILKEESNDRLQRKIY
jgi:hypothetical protein